VADRRGFKGTPGVSILNPWDTPAVSQVRRQAAPMVRYTATRLILAIPILLVVFTLVFLVVRIIPGDPAQAALGDYASKEAVDALRESMGLNEPLLVQYFRYLGGLLQ